MEFLKIKDEMDYARKRYELKRNIEDMFTSEGYLQVEPSVFEDYNNFTSINKKIEKESMVKVLDGNGKVFILRPDITINIIKSLIPRWEDNLKLKLFYNSTIYKNKLNSNIKELRQIGCECLGESSLDADREIIGLALKVLKGYSDNFILEIGSSKYINSFFKELNLKENIEREIKGLIYKKNRCELIDYLQILNLDKEMNELLMNLLDLEGNLEDVINKAKLLYMNDDMKKAIKELTILKEFIEECGYIKYIQFDLSMMTILDYYNGVIFRGYYPNSYKEIISGGRYDFLTEAFGKEIPAIGFSINLDELMKVTL